MAKKSGKSEPAPVVDAAPVVESPAPEPEQAAAPAVEVDELGRALSGPVIFEMNDVREVVEMRHRRRRELAHNGFVHEYVGDEGAARVYRKM